MSSFTALNVEPEEESEEEVDDIDEVYLEDAFKLYQNALKLHSYGPPYLENAKEAYEELFRSEIFQYPEAISEYRRNESDFELSPMVRAEHVAQDFESIQSATVQVSSNSLPQMLHISFKNYAECLFEVYVHRKPTSADFSVGNNAASQELLQLCVKVIQNFASALENDDTDLNLWRKAAYVSQICASGRILRFCVESVLAGDEEENDNLQAVLGLDEIVAAGQLKQILASLSDDVSVECISLLEPKEELVELLDRRLQLFPFLPSSLSRQRDLDFTSDSVAVHVPKQRVLQVQSRSWDQVGQALLPDLSEVRNSCIDVRSGLAVYLEAPTEVHMREATNPSGVSRSGGRSRGTIEKGECLQGVAPESSFSVPSAGREGFICSGDERIDPILKSPIRDDQNKSDNAAIETKATFTNFTDGCQKPLQPEKTLSLPTRKRTADLAGHDEPPGGGRLKSKRIRDRDFHADQSTQHAGASDVKIKDYENELAGLRAADNRLHHAEIKLLEKVGVRNIEEAEGFRPDLAYLTQDGQAQLENSHRQLLQPHEVGIVLLNLSSERLDQEAPQRKEDSDTVGEVNVLDFLERSTSTKPEADSIPPLNLEKKFDDFIQWCNEGWHNKQEAALEWLKALISPAAELKSASEVHKPQSSSYLSSLWPAALSQTVKQIITIYDFFIHEYVQWRFEELSSSCLLSEGKLLKHEQIEAASLVEMSEALYELHLDNLSTDEADGTEMQSQTLRLDRLRRWSSLTASLINMLICHGCLQGHLTAPILIRYLWATTLHIKMTPETSPEHLKLCQQDLHRFLQDANISIISLPNNSAMPEVSIRFLEQEISRMNVLGFFEEIFADISHDPATVLENLEPILESEESWSQDRAEDDTCPANPTAVTAPTAWAQEIAHFLEQGGPALKLFLWRRLGVAYSAIDHPPGVVFCYLRSIGTICKELFTDTSSHFPAQARGDSTLKRLLELNHILTNTLRKIEACENAFEMFDDRCMKAAILSVSQLCHFSQGLALIEDYFRVGLLPDQKDSKQSNNKLLIQTRGQLQEMHVKLRALQWMLIKETMLQQKLRPDENADEVIDYLGSLHQTLGFRGCCGDFGKYMLHLLATDIMSIPSPQKRLAETAQILYDLYRLKIAPGIGHDDHHCLPESLDKSSAAAIVPLIMQQARQMPLKDLQRSELRTTIDKVQSIIGLPKLVPAQSYNRRSISAFLRSPVLKWQLFHASRGEGSILTRVVRADSAKTARTGWYFLLGDLALSRFRSMKRTNSGPLDDLDNAITYFKYDLEHDAERWDTWFRLAQAYDSKLEEELLWTAEKINSHRTELATLQRHAIHCYERALALSICHADESIDHGEKSSDMFKCFANRLYASSREPLRMDAFDNHRFQKHFSSTDEQSILYQAPIAPQMSDYSVWKFSAHLLRQALIHKPRDWDTHFMLGKCLWKMLMRSEYQATQKIKISEVLQEFIQAIKLLPEKKDKADHILEPHFKLVSAVHKLVQHQMMTPEEGSKVLQSTPWARNVPLLDEDGSWRPYVLEVLKKLGQADRSNWHHRIVARAANINYNSNDENSTGAIKAKNEMSQQIFTKTMTVQVWKPEFERAGRHFVYKSRYVSFFANVLGELLDRANMDLLAKKIRRKNTEFMNHQQLWEQVVTAYANMLRRIGKAPKGQEEAVFRIVHSDEFVRNSAELEAYANDATTSDATLDVLNDAIELKKLNSSLMKGPLLDDLIVDCYATLYQKLNEIASSQCQPKPTKSELTLKDASQVNQSIESLQQSQRDGPMDESLPPQGDAARSSTVASKVPKPKMVTRREVQRQAESLVARPAAQKTHFSSKNDSVMQTTEVVVHIPNHPENPGIAPQISDGASNIPDSQSSRLTSLVSETPVEPSRSIASSPAGSLHDSADDESDLSELDDSDSGLDEYSSREVLGFSNDPSSHTEAVRNVSGLSSLLSGREVQHKPQQNIANETSRASEN